MKLDFLSTAWCIAGFCCGFLGVLPIAAAREIRTMREFRQLDQQEAAKKPALRLRATVNYYVPERFRLYIQDGMSASYAMPASNVWQAGFASGDLVEFTGHAENGDLSPIVVFSSYRIVRKNQLPRAARMSASDLTVPSSECRRIRFVGRVLSASVPDAQPGIFESGSLELVVGTPENRANVIVDRSGSLDIQALTGANIDLKGVVAHASRYDQMLRAMIFVEHARDIKIIEPAERDSFTLPVEKINSLLRFHTARSGGRVHVRGVVTAYAPDGSFFMQDETRGVSVETSQPFTPRQGERIDVVGYAQPGPYSPVLRYAVQKSSSEFVDEVPIHIAALEIPDFSVERYESSWLKHDGKLVEVQAELIGQQFTPNETSLLLRLGPSVFSAKLQVRQDRPQGLETGSTLRLRGVCTVVVTGVHHRAEGMQLLLRSPSDIAVLKTPPWWQGRRLAWVLAIGGTGIPLLAGWVFTLRLQVRRQTAQLRDRATRDGLTCIWNRGEILSLLDRELARARTGGSSLTVIMIDLDHFKSINDTFGHQAGDAVLVEICTRLRQVIRPLDLIGRYGGEELLAIIPGGRFGPDQERIEGMRLAVSHRPVLFGEIAIEITCSLGVSWSADGTETAGELIHHADAALYRAKRNGRDRVEWGLVERRTSLASVEQAS